MKPRENKKLKSFDLLIYPLEIVSERPMQTAAINGHVTFLLSLSSSF